MTDDDLITCSVEKRGQPRRRNAHPFNALGSTRSFLALSEVALLAVHLYEDEEHVSSDGKCSTGAT